MESVSGAEGLVPQDVVVMRPYNSSTSKKVSETKPALSDISDYDSVSGRSDANIDPASVVRAQVEFYFSEENMIISEHFRAISGGALNRPVSLGQIIGFRKMREILKAHNLKRRDVIQFLKDSDILEVVDDKAVRRRVPLEGTSRSNAATGQDSFVQRVAPAPISEDATNEGNQNGDEEDVDPTIPPPGFRFDKNGYLLQIRPMESKRATGLEPYFAEAPLTPQEAEENSERYSTDVGPVNRLEIAIQDYFHKRKLDQASREILMAYLRYGGISTSPNAFAHLDRQHGNDLGFADKKAALSTFHIMPEKFISDHWRIDFETVAKGFLSTGLLRQMPRSGETRAFVDVACYIVINFLNYLLYHNVLPEPKYRASIFNTREFFQNDAAAEMKACFDTPRLLPGCWTDAMFHLYDQNYDTTFVKPAYADEDDDSKRRRLHLAAPEVVAQGIKSARLHSNALDLPGKVWEDLTALFIGEGAIEIIEVKSHVNDDKDSAEVAVLQVRPWLKPSNDCYDLPKGVQYTPPFIKYTKNISSMELWIDTIGVHDKLTAGMKIEGTMMLLDIKSHDRRSEPGAGGIWVLGGHTTVYPSFYTVLLNDLNSKAASRAPHLEEKEKEWKNVEGGEGTPVGDGQEGQDDEGW